jgi:hypothetical protein
MVPRSELDTGGGLKKWFQGVNSILAAPLKIEIFSTRPCSGDLGRAGGAESFRIWPKKNAV